MNYLLELVLLAALTGGNVFFALKKKSEGKKFQFILHTIISIIGVVGFIAAIIIIAGM